MPDSSFEKLGAFYLGRGYDLDARARTGDLLLYDSRDLVTHAVCVGMTGSGKTGLCMTLLEEAAIDGIPAIVVDPKGDLANLLLTFPDLSPADFAPWINEDDARRKGVDPSQYAAQQAELWKEGLAEWGQDGLRIRRLRDSADFSVYTPGSSAGLSVSVLKSFEAPAAEIIDDTEIFAERVSSTATSLLGLLGIEANPLQSREHILLSTIFSRAWEAGENLDLAALISRIQTPPTARIGVVEIETFFPSKDRFAFAMQLNNLIASPAFARWLEGDPLDIGAMLYTPAGRPRVSIFSIAHLPDAERMFFVSMLLNQMLGWVRTQSGTTSLRALLYMDEIAGYFPPVANPPSKEPLLTLMKQARAYGVGVVLATQNPVDLDYKGLSNAGTWFIGRLQTDQDKQRVLDGLEGASSTSGGRFERRAVDAMLSRLGSRVFLMNNIHEDAPVVFETRWALSYLRGPLTRNQIRSLTDGRRADQPPKLATPATPPGPAARSPIPQASPRQDRPVLPPEIPQYFIPARQATSTTITYRAMVLGSARVYYNDTKSGADVDVPACYLAPIEAGPVAVDWEHAAESTMTEEDLKTSPAVDAAFGSVPSEAANAKSYDAWKKSLADAIFRTHRLALLRSDSYKLTSRPGESEREFRLRLHQAAREGRDAAADRLRQKYAPRLASLQDRLRRARQAVEVQREQARSANMSTAVSFGAALLSAFTGRKAASAGNIGRAASAAKGVSRSAKESSDVGRAEENAAAVESQLQALEEQFRAELQDLTMQHDPAAEQVTPVSLKPKKANITIRAVVLAWAPFTTGLDGQHVPAWA
ncbi:MAG: ATP-binding protein [Phycisphaerales bacterium]|nr:ATP-binding protein [Phycisphaerales bacterium]